MALNKMHPANESVLDISLGTIQTLSKGLRALKNDTHGASVAAMSKDMIMQFPVFMSSSISNEDGRTITLALERQYAHFVMLTLQSYLNVNSERYTTIQDFIKDIHSNDNCPKLFNYCFGLMQNINSAVNGSAHESFTPNQDMMMSLWYGADNEVTMESLNSKYLPNSANIHKLSSALEANESFYNTPYNPADAGQGREDEIKQEYDRRASSRRTSSRHTSSRYSRGVDPLSDVANGVNAWAGHRANGDKFPSSYQGSDNKRHEITMSNNDLPSIKENKLQSSFEPTMITANIYLNNEKRTFAVGVKTMVRSVSSSAMVMNLSDSVVNRQFAFQFTKWTRGEIKFFRDVIFDLTNIRRETIAKMRAENQKDTSGYGYFAAMKERRRNARAFVGGPRALSPISTIICTKYEVEEVKAQCGLDLENPVYAKNMMNELYLLAFVIYDPTTGVVQTMLDGGATNNDFAITTIDALKKKSGDQSIGDVTKFVHELGMFR